ncbi:aldo/keto reductase [Nostoc sp.]|uniref:aldo/keto reductase n=1 Tax=Nostoc sp. TaxID=1180 RepID=UPI002FFD0FA2
MERIVSIVWGSSAPKLGVTIHRALELGIIFLNTADMYGLFTNEQLVGKAIIDRRDKMDDPCNPGRHCPVLTFRHHSQNFL